MNNKIISFFFLLLLSTFFGCSNKNTKSAECKTIDLEEGIEKNKSLNLNQIASQVEYIPLETNDSIILGHTNAIITKSNIVVLDDVGIYLFDKKGKFIRKIGQKGQGPNEYRNVNNFNYISIDEASHSIFVKTDSKKELMRFNYDGSYSKFINISPCNGFIYYNSMIYAHKSYLYFKESDKEVSQLMVFDNTGKIINKFHPVNLNKTKYWDMFMEVPDFSVLDNELFYYLVREDTIYHVNKNKFTPFYQLHLGKYSFSSDYRWDYQGYANARKENKAWIVRSFVTKSYVFFVVEQKRKRRVVVYDRKKNKIYNNLTNDIDCVPISYISEIYQNKIVTCLYPGELLECRNKENLPKDLRNILKNLSEEDNPILRVVTLK